MKVRALVRFVELSTPCNGFRLYLRGLRSNQRLSTPCNGFKTKPKKKSWIKEAIDFQLHVMDSVM